jgi:hypothetical protein
MSVSADLDRIAAHWPRIDSCLDDAMIARRDDAVSKWGVGQQLLHLLRAKKMIAGGITQMIVTGKPMPSLLTPPAEDMSEFRRQVLATGIPRGVGDSPAFLRVDAPPSMDEIRKEFAEARAAWSALLDHADQIEACTVTFAHHRLGNMKPAEWLSFIAHHNDLHLGIIEDILASTVAD